MLNTTHEEAAGFISHTHIDNMLNTTHEEAAGFLSHTYDTCSQLTTNFLDL